MSKMDYLERKLFGDKTISSLQGPAGSSHWLLWTVSVLFLLFILWASFGVVDVQVHASGKIVPSKKVKVMQFAEVARIKEISVVEGQKVKKGQVLILIDDTPFESTYREGFSKALALKAKIARLMAENKGENFSVSDEVKAEFPTLVAYESALLKSNQNRMVADVSILEAQKNRKLKVLDSFKEQSKQIAHSNVLVQKELKMLRPLVDQGAASEIEVLRLQRTANDILGRLTNTNMQIQSTEHEIEELKHRIDSLEITKKSEVLDKLAEAKSELTSLQESNIGLADRVDKAIIRSPVNGIVKQIHVSTIGEVVSPEVDLIEIVPDDESLLIEAFVQPSDIAFLKIGQPVMVQITAYDYTIYGSFKGTLEHISADTTVNKRGESFYEIWVRTDKNYLFDKATGEKLTIKVGMDAEVSIQTGKKTIMSYIMKPILKAKSSALTER